MRLHHVQNFFNSRLTLNTYRGTAFYSISSQNAPNTRVTGEGQPNHKPYSLYYERPMPLATPGHNKLRRSSSRYTSQQTIGSMHWLFRTNIPRRRSSYYPSDPQKRNFFGIGEILSVITNPAETVRSLTESKRLLEEARQEINENRERSQIRPKHTFSRLPGFFPRRAEAKAIERALEGEPAFTVLFGASSVGKTALLREVLCRDSYHVLHFDLRIAGFADLTSLYMSLSRQMEQYFEAMSVQMQGYKEFEKEAWSFKHDRLNVERRMSEVPPDSGVSRVKTSDIARLMELFQSSLLKYWEFDPYREDRKGKRGGEEQKTQPNESHIDIPDKTTKTKHERKKFPNFLRLKGKHETADPKRPVHERERKEEKEAKRRKQPAKKMPVIFFDEAHKLPALIQSTDAMNCLLSAFLVLTKQDRLCHVIHATSDPFYHTWLRQLNVMQHCKIITIGDCSKAETRAFFRDQILPRVPEDIQYGLNFEVLYDAFGGKLVHWQDFVTDYVNCNGRLNVKQSSHFLQAHALLNLHIIHSSEHPPEHEGQENNPTQPPSSSRLPGFKIYSAISNPHGPNTHDPDGSTTAATYGDSDFTAMQLLRVISRITEPGTTYLPYFALCREYGVHAVDGMVKGRILDLRWTEPVTKESEPEDASYMNRRSRPISIEGEESNGRTLVENSNHLDVNGAGASEEDIVPIPEQEVFSHNRRRRSSRLKSVYQSNDDFVIGPKLVPTTPIMKFAMREVLHEYDDSEVVDGDDVTISEYASAASLSDVEEY